MKKKDDTVYIDAADILGSTLSYGSSVSLSGSSTITSNSPIYTANSSVYTAYPSIEQIIDDKLKEYCDFTDKHLDDLEEDIEFLDKMRKEMNNGMAFHDAKVDEFENKIHLLEDENTKLRADLNILQSQIYMLQQRLDNQ